MVAFALSCFGLVLFLWLAFGGAVPFKPKGYRFVAQIPETTQLAKESDVRISGVSVGKVKQIETNTDGPSHVTIELESKYAPIRIDSRAMLRQKTLLGETYIELTPGTPSAKPLADGGTLPRSNVRTTVELD
jgi:virulence factor Mce-like protein